MHLFVKAALVELEELAEQLDIPGSAEFAPSSDKLPPSSVLTTQNKASQQPLISTKTSHPKELRS